MRAHHLVAPALANALRGACAVSLGACAVSLGACAVSGLSSAPHPAPPPTSSPAAAAEAANGPLRPPRPGILGCVESRELKDYVLALDVRREQARRSALEALGATPDDRRGVFGASSAAALDRSYEADGKRFAVAAELAPQFEPRASLARQGALLRRIDERPRAHAVDVLVCGVERCARPASGQRVAVRPVLVELRPGESWGGPLELGYDYWWARVRYDRRETCAPQPSGS